MELAVVVGGLGYAGSRHAAVLVEMGYEVEVVDVRGGRRPGELPSLAEKAELIVFAEPPGERPANLRLALSASTKPLIVLEKPPLRPQEWRMLLGLPADWVPVHNYLYSQRVREAIAEGRLEVVVLRPGPHHQWYTSLQHSGGGVLLDHGYHWLYVAHEIGAKNITVYVDSLPDTTAWLTADNVKAYMTWNSPIRLTIVNGKPWEPRGREMMDTIRALYRDILDNPERRARLRAQAIWVLSIIEEAYSRFPWMYGRPHHTEPDVSTADAKTSRSVFGDPILSLTFSQSPETEKNYTGVAK